MINCLPILRYIPLAAIICSISIGCTPAHVEDAIIKETPLEERQPPRNLAIHPFTPVKTTKAGAEEFDAAVNQIEARLFSIMLKQTLTTSGQWGQVYFIPGTDQADELVLSGRITVSTPNMLQIESEILNNEHISVFSRIYKSSAPGGPDKRFQDIADRIRADLADLDEENSGSMADRGGIDSTINKSVSTLDEIIVEAVATYGDIYYDDLIEPFSNLGQSDKSETISLIALEKEIRTGQLQAVAAVVGAVLSRCLPQHSFTNEPLHVLVEDKQFGHYSNFQPVRDYARSIAQARELGVVIDAENSDYKLITESNTYILNGSAEEQYSKWRRMIVDLCGESL